MNDTEEKPDIIYVPTNRSNANLPALETISCSENLISMNDSEEKPDIISVPTNRSNANLPALEAISCFENLISMNDTEKKPDVFSASDTIICSENLISMNDTEEKPDIISVPTNRSNANLPAIEAISCFENLISMNDTEKKPDVFSVPANRSNANLTASNTIICSENLISINNAISNDGSLINSNSQIDLIKIAVDELFRDEEGMGNSTLSNACKSVSQPLSENFGFESMNALVAYLMTPVDCILHVPKDNIDDAIINRFHTDE